MRRRQMCIMVWRDMLTQIKNHKWFQVNRENGLSTGYWVIYIFCIMPLIWGVFQDMRNAVLYFTFVIALVLSLLLGTICPMRLPKIMYLCPMEAKERRQYLVTSYVTKILLSVLVSCIAGIIPFALGYVPWYSAAMNAFSIVMLAMSINMAGGARAFQPSAKDKALKKRCSAYPRWLIVQQIYAIIYLAFMFIGQDMNGEENMSWIVIVLCLVLSAINLLLTLMLFTFFKGTLDVLMDYETVYETE